MTYQYRATLERLVDGDTLWLNVDLGFRTHAVQDFRLHGINAPELSTSRGVAARVALEHMLDGVPPNGLAVTVYKDPDNYGRWLAVVVRPDGINVNSWMLTNGFAEPYPKKGG